MVSKRIGFILALALALVGCRPRGVLSQQQMVDIAFDLHKAEAVASHYGYYSSEEDLSHLNYNVLARHGVTQAVWDSSMVWYTAHPKRYQKIYPKVMERFEKELALLDERAERERLARDGEAALPRNTLRDLDVIRREYLLGFWLWR